MSELRKRKVKLNLEFAVPNEFKVEKAPPNSSNDFKISYEPQRYHQMYHQPHVFATPPIGCPEEPDPLPFQGPPDDIANGGPQPCPPPPGPGQDNQCPPMGICIPICPQSLEQLRLMMGQAQFQQGQQPQQPQQWQQSQQPQQGQQSQQPQQGADPSPCDPFIPQSLQDSPPVDNQDTQNQGGPPTQDSSCPPIPAPFCLPPDLSPQGQPPPPPPNPNPPFTLPPPPNCQPPSASPPPQGQDSMPNQDQNPWVIYNTSTSVTNPQGDVIPDDQQQGQFCSNEELLRQLMECVCGDPNVPSQTLPDKGSPFPPSDTPPASGDIPTPQSCPPPPPPSSGPPPSSDPPPDQQQQGQPNIGLPFNYCWDRECDCVRVVAKPPSCPPPPGQDSLEGQGPGQLQDSNQDLPPTVTYNSNVSVSNCRDPQSQTALLTNEELLKQVMECVCGNKTDQNGLTPTDLDQADFLTPKSDRVELRFSQTKPLESENSQQDFCIDQNGVLVPWPSNVGQSLPQQQDGGLPDQSIFPPCQGIDLNAQFNNPTGAPPIPKPIKICEGSDFDPANPPFDPCNPPFDLNNLPFCDTTDDDDPCADSQSMFDMAFFFYLWLFCLAGSQLVRLLMKLYQCWRKCKDDDANIDNCANDPNLQIRSLCGID